jgi:hypothetical protein
MVIGDTIAHIFAKCRQPNTTYISIHKHVCIIIKTNMYIFLVLKTSEIYKLFGLVVKCGKVPGKFRETGRFVFSVKEDVVASNHWDRFYKAPFRPKSFRNFFLLV